MERVILGKNGYQVMDLNRRSAIHERCLNCSGWIPSEVKNCSHVKCDLYPYRTGMGTQNSRARHRAIRNHCLECMNGQVGEVAKCPSVKCSLFAYRKGGLERVMIAPSVDKNGDIEGCFLINERTMDKAKGVSQPFRKTMSM
jgi:hypothetical protein